MPISVERSQYRRIHPYAEACGCPNSLKRIRSENQIARLRMTPMATAMMVESAADTAWLPRRSSVQSAPGRIHRKTGREGTLMVSSPPTVPANRGSSVASAAGSEGAYELYNHNEGARRRVGDAEAIEYLCWPQPT